MIYERLLRPLLFGLDPEQAHNLALTAIRSGLVFARRFVDESLAQNLFGVHFPNPLGLAAGFDKNAVALDRWAGLGFGFAEVGTVTQLAQPGNPRPRLFRLPEDHALINRMGFNNDGAERVANRLQQRRPGVPIGVNIGKSKVTPVEDAADDYVSSFRLLAPRADYVVVNVSSPNTPGLRSLQEKGPLTDILYRLQALDPSKPLFVKIAPDLSLGEIDDVVEVVHCLGLTGIVATNTTVERSGLIRDPRESGGLSGRPLRSLSEGVIEYLYSSCNSNVILIGVGGIETAQDLFRRVSLGAHLCQIYTGWIYGGPGSVPNLLESFSSLLHGEGMTLAELRGSQRKSSTPA